MKTKGFMSFTCRSIDRGKVENFPLVCFIISPSRSLWKRHADVFNVFSQCLSFAFNGIISHRPAIKSIFSWSPSLHYGHTASYKIHQKLIEKNYCHFFHRRIDTNGQLSFIDGRQERDKKINFIIFSIIFPSGKYFKSLQTVSQKRSRLKMKKKFKSDKRITKSLLSCSVPVTRWKKRKLRILDKTVFEIANVRSLSFKSEWNLYQI